MEELYKTAAQIVYGQKGILAADESEGTIKKRFDAISLASTDETRRAYRELLFTTPNIEQYIGGVIMFDETIKQRTHAGIPFAEVLSQKGIVPGIKVDKGTVELTNFEGEKATEGLDGLSERLREYKALGARFAKWRAVIVIGDKIPTQTSIDSNAYLLARYAAMCQKNGIVPIVEPEVLMDGSHTLKRCQEVTYATLKIVFTALSAHKIEPKGMLLKPNMVISGSGAPKSTPAEIAAATMSVFAQVLPHDLAAVVFLSGGQSPTEATLNMQEIVKDTKISTRITYSFGRALQEPVLTTWKGNDDNREEAQKVFLKRAKLNSLASIGQYNPSMETQP